MDDMFWVIAVAALLLAVTEIIAIIVVWAHFRDPVIAVVSSIIVLVVYGNILLLRIYVIAVAAAYAQYRIWRLRQKYPPPPPPTSVSMLSGAPAHGPPQLN